MSRVAQVKNRSAAPIQITAEQLLREAKERQLEEKPRAPKQYIADNEELQLYRQSKRKDFEDQIRHQRQFIGTWCKYALWEASQKEFERARSVFERAIDVDYRNQTLWFKYAEMEMKNEFINHARNVWDRAVTLHPRVDNFWFKYTYMEEMAGAIEQARQLFERWMKWEPDDMAWSAYIKFEVRQGEIGRARGVLERYVACHPTPRAYLKYARWEERQQQKAFARTVYERSLVEIPESERRDGILTAFARFEERCKEFDRARAIYKFALDTTTREESPDLFAEYASFEKRHGDRKGIEEVVVAKKRSEYESVLSEDSFHYDTWFDYIRLEESEGDLERIRSVYQRSVSNVPPIAEKRYWRRYIYLWINYAIFEELVAEDAARTREVYKACLNVIPHRVFTFGKIWMMAAHFEVRQKDLAAARKLLGTAIGLCFWIFSPGFLYTVTIHTGLTGKENIFKGYVELELQLGEVERCRAIYGKYLEHMPHNCTAWKAFAQLETNVGEIARAR
jgi:crooked neck